MIAEIGPDTASCYAAALQLEVFYRRTGRGVLEHIRQVKDADGHVTSRQVTEVQNPEKEPSGPDMLLLQGGVSQRQDHALVDMLAVVATEQRERDAQGRHIGRDEFDFLSTLFGRDRRRA